MLFLAWHLFTLCRYVYKIFQMSFVAFITSTLFIHQRMHHNITADGTLRFGLIFFSIVQLLMDGFSEVLPALIWNSLCCSDIFFIAQHAVISDTLQ